MQNQQSLHNEVKLEAVSNFGVVNEFSPNKALERKAITYANNWLNSTLDSYVVNHITVTPSMKTSLLKQFEQKKSSFLAQQGEVAYGSTQAVPNRVSVPNTAKSTVPTVPTASIPKNAPIAKVIPSGKGTVVQPFPSSRDWSNLDPSNKKQLFNAINSLGKKNGK